jgi:hypothetical protein
VKARARLACFLRGPFDAVVDALEPIARGDRVSRDFLWLAVSVVVCWYLYVPAHELLHAAGCALSGGTVTTLEIQRQYGGGLLEGFLPFVRAGGEYAGRLSDFDTHGSDLVYLATDALPFTLSVVGVPLLRRARLRPSPWMAGAGLVLALAPFYNIPGDYYEMGSIVATAPLDPTPWHALRSDDVLRLAREFFAETPAPSPGAASRAAAPALQGVVVGLSAGLAVLLAYATWSLGLALDRALPGGARRVDTAVPTSGGAPPVG